MEFISYSIEDKHLWKFWWETFSKTLVPKLPFDTFSPYIHLYFLPEQKQREVMGFLETLYQETGSLWVPGGCRSTDTIANRAVEILSVGVFSSIKALRIQRYGRMHFWFEILVEDCEDIIIVDVTGVPLDIKNYTEDITPFIGRIEDAHDEAIHVYSHKEDYDGNTNDLPLGFRI